MKHVVKIGYVVSVTLLMAGCDETFGNGAALQTSPANVSTTAAAQEQPRIRPKPRLGALQTMAPKPVQTAHTVEQFDTTTNAQRAEAVASASQGGERKLGPTVGSLGDPAEPGFWLKTPLVSAATKGRVEYPATGKSVAVDLIPIKGAKTAGSRVSLAALRLLGAPLTDLPNLVVYTK